jgi:hypothetical protein
MTVERYSFALVRPSQETDDRPLLHLSKLCLLYGVQVLLFWVSMLTLLRQLPDFIV